ncbi:MAG TPA: GNAT family N-acetyltransferase [Xanthobacteraceae bacterium]|nr:GNAT family N-acetyltransferase [Xanthobacteraceae bacterium]
MTTAPAPREARWRPMRHDDLATVNDLARKLHPAYPEAPEVFDEKLRLFPQGCFTLQDADAGTAGYCFSHPWTRELPPALDRLLGRLPPRPDTYFVHDLAIDEALRGQRLAALLLPVLAAVAKCGGLEHMTLIAVNASEAFWRKAGFAVTADPTLQRAVRAKYSDEAVHMEMQLGAF